MISASPSSDNRQIDSFCQEIPISRGRGLTEQLVPGSGEIDFQRITTCLKKDTKKGLELKPETSDSEISRAIRIARKEFC